MQATLIKNVQKWNPRKLEIVFETEREFEVFKYILQTNESIPEVVCHFNRKCGYLEVKEILTRIYRAFRG